jgi:cell division septum initiation protein DivIVA
MKKFTISCHFGVTKASFAIYVGEPSEKFHPIYFQNLWLAKLRGGNIPHEVGESFSKLHNIALENNVSFEDLTMQALGSAAEKQVEEIKTDPNAQAKAILQQAKTEAEQIQSEAAKAAEANLAEAQKRSRQILAQINPSSPIEKQQAHEQITSLLAQAQAESKQLIANGDLKAKGHILRAEQQVRMLMASNRVEKE